LWNTKCHYCVHKSPPLVLTVKQMYPVRALPPHVPKITLILYTQLHLGLPNSPSPSGFPTRPLHAFLFPGMHVTCSAHLIFLYLITQTTFGKKYNSCNSSLCNFIYPPLTFSLLGCHTFLCTQFSKSFSLSSLFNARDQVSHLYKQWAKLFLYSLIFVSVSREQMGRQKHCQLNGCKCSPDLNYTMAQA
jgi:hypothetical protein